MRSLPFFLLAAGVVAAPAALAQTTFRLGARAGANLACTTLAGASNASSYAYNFAADKAALFAWQAGLAGEVAFGGALAVQPALVFTQKGERLTTHTTTRDAGFPYDEQRELTSRYNWLELPLHVVYSPRGLRGLQLLAGPYLAVAVGGYQRGTAYTYYGSNVFSIPQHLDGPVRYGDDSHYRRFDAGLNFGLGYRRGPAQVQLSYGLGLPNLRQAQPEPLIGIPTHDYAADAARNRVLQLTAAYFIDLSGAPSRRGPQP